MTRALPSFKKLGMLAGLLATVFAADIAHAQDAAVPAASPAATAPAENNTDAFENEFKAFREKMQAAQGAAAPADASPVAASPVAQSPVASPMAQSPLAAQSPIADMNASPLASPVNEMAAPASPLGPAANLPVGSPLSPGAYSMTPAEMQMQMEAQAAEQQKKIEEQTFDAALKDLLPLQPGQIRSTLEKFKESREAAETPIADPEPKQVVETVSLDPSDAPVVIKMAPGNVTTLTILDSTGAPWPIQDVSWAGKFVVTPPEDGGHVIRLTPESAHGVGNISIRLVDLVTPITMSLKTGLDEVYYRFDARIPKQGPLAKPSIIEYGGLKAIAGKDADMDGILDGTPPAGAEKMTVEGADGRTTAYKVDGRLYLRTPLTLLSPGWEASISSADGMNVYNLSNAPVILLSDQGRVVRAHLQGEEEVLP